MEFNIADLFECVADHVPDRVAVVAGNRRASYAALDDRTTRLAHSLRAHGVARDDLVALLMPNDMAHVEALLACFKARAVPINVNHRYTPDELAYLMRDAGAKALLFHSAWRDQLDALPRDASPPLVAVTGTAQPSDVLSWEELASAGSPDRDLGRRSGDDRYVLYTGGTTGLPKGVVWRQEDIFFAVLGGGNPGGPPIARPEEIGTAVLANPGQRLTAFLGDAPPPDQFVQLALGPLMHASGQWSALGTLLGGGRVVLYTRRSVDMEVVLDLVERERVTGLNLVGDASARPLLDTLEAHPGRWDTDSLRLLGSGGTSLSAESKARLFDALPSVLAITEAIGSSEAPAQAVSVVTRDGVALPTLHFRPKIDTIVVDDELHPVPPGSGVVGRLATHGHIPLGYLGDDNATQRTFTEIDGVRWVLPGDMATVEADGTVKLLGRGALCINTGGEKVYAEEVEAALLSHPTVVDAAVVGVPDERHGEAVAAVVAPVDPGASVSLDELVEHCRTRLAGYKIPRRLAVADTINRTAVGKIDYGWAREQFANG